jgi:hypothetical protein
MSIKHLYLVVAAAFLGCASGGNDPGNLAGTSYRKANVLTSYEISQAHADVNTAYDAVARLRSNWLAAHGITSGMSNGAGTEYAIVFVDGQQYGDLNALRSIPAFNVREMHYYNITEAGARFGIRGGSSGVIEVLTNLQSKS